jgi:DNA-binding PadR family transcriptional regulator
MKLTVNQVYYLRTVRRYYDNDRYMSWVIGNSGGTFRALLKRGLIEENPHPRQQRDRQSHRPTEAGRQALAAYEGREISVSRNYRRGPSYTTYWVEPKDAVSKLGSLA